MRESKIVPAIKFKSCAMLDSWNNLEIPAVIFKHKCALIESKLTIMINGRRKMETTEVLQILKLIQDAAIIGNIFSSRLLAKIINKQTKVSEINKLLDKIEDCDLIEMVYNEVFNEERFYRFNHHLCSTTLY